MFKYRGFADGVNPEMIEFIDENLAVARERAMNWFLARIAERHGVQDRLQMEWDSGLRDYLGVNEPTPYGVVVSFVIETPELDIPHAIWGEEDQYYRQAAIEQEENILRHYWL